MRYPKELPEGLLQLSKHCGQVWVEVEPVSRKLEICCRMPIVDTQIADRVDETVARFISIFGEGSTTFWSYSASKGRGRKKKDGGDPDGSLVVRIFMEAGE